MKKRQINVAVLDLYDNEPNQGMRCIKEIIESWDGKIHDLPVSYNIYDVRYKTEVPNLQYDIYISSGGPGSPYDGEGSKWEKEYFRLLDRIWNHNQQNNDQRKFLFFICHSFQMMARFFDLATVQKRNKQSFGIIPVTRTKEARADQLLGELPDTYYAADFRQFEVVAPKEKVFRELNAKLLSREKFRIDPTMERALMAVRLSDEIFGTQYHPEADPISMLYHFQQPERKTQVVAEYGEDQYYNMIEHLEDPTNILLTRSKILPVFLKTAIEQIAKNSDDNIH